MPSKYMLGALDTVDFAATGITAKIQEVQFILSQMKGESVLNVEAGWNQAVDAPLNFAKDLMRVSIKEAIEGRVEGVTVEDITFEEDLTNGKLIPYVKVVIE